MDNLLGLLCLVTVFYAAACSEIYNHNITEDTTDAKGWGNLTRDTTDAKGWGNLTRDTTDAIGWGNLTRDLNNATLGWANITRDDDDKIKPSGKYLRAVLIIDNGLQDDDVTLKPINYSINGSHPILRQQYNDEEVKNYRKKIKSLLYQEYNKDGTLRQEIMMYNLNDVKKFFDVFITPIVCIRECTGLKLNQTKPTYY